MSCTLIKLQRTEFSWKGELRIKFTRDILSEMRISPCLHKDESIKLKCSLAYSYDSFFFQVVGVEQFSESEKISELFGNASQERETLEKQCILN